MRYTKEERQEIVRAVDLIVGRYKVCPKKPKDVFSKAYDILPKELKSKILKDKQSFLWVPGRIYKEEKSPKDYRIFEQSLDDVFLRIRHFSGIPNAGLILDALMPILAKKYVELIKQGVDTNSRTIKMREHMFTLIQNDDMKSMLNRSALSHLWERVLPEHMNEYQRGIYDLDCNGRIFKGKQKPVIVPPSKIGNRLGAGGLRDLANQASQSPAGAGGNKPRDQYVGVNRPKPPR